MPSFSFPQVLEIAIIIVVLLFSVIIHEVAHGYVASLNGDPTAKMLGRLTLNPIPHIDPMGTILMPLILYMLHLPIIGMARPVPVNPRNYRNYRWGELTVSAAGCVSNLALAVIFAFLLRLGFGNLGLRTLAEYGIQINILLALFNLIPIPPLDGSHILSLFLPPNLARLYAYLEPVGLILILILFYTGIMGLFLLPAYRLIIHLLLG
jgi:Zn-dependent protease